MSRLTAAAEARTLAASLCKDHGVLLGKGGLRGNVIRIAPPLTISADQVERVELIRVRTREIDLQGYPEVINVILYADAPATIRWEVYFRYNLDQGLTPFAGLSYSDRWQDVEARLRRKVVRGDDDVAARRIGGRRGDRNGERRDDEQQFTKHVVQG